ncbi:BTAD domain-containing putative transcriptional regulator [Lentzea sp. BCCO 10_0061]|uniref:BTAD domain-containing putative transcriptional regulator n=1 Tax=Lentzea sokolovensis TaxID=3095429 RepID=A0ABU4USY7_9PSEU|nr:BTAD domain-containing putative transcriptional regulator [Lentzea sp. BCCO 10_0061]MDX8142612.1 BTAD domain-containing putative transcriptional regulator [Lentzea sp. BCCO 10_0061]
MRVEYRVLGPLEVLLDGVPVTVPAGRCRVLLGTLLLRANEFVSVDEIVERLWDGVPPSADRAGKTLHMVVTRLRQALGVASCVRTRPGGYVAVVEPEQLDLLRFRAHLKTGEHAAATALWRGPVLANVPSESLHRDLVPALVEERLAALEKRIDDDLELGVAAELVPELRTLTTRHPVHEVFWAQLMLALHRSGQQADALATYQEVTAVLGEQLGVTPGPRLREAQQQVLAGEIPSGAVLVPSHHHVPRQLPTALPHFVGRERELDRLDAVLASGQLVINGSGGIGKTSLAVQWAHRIAGRFPDGQLYSDLRGFDPTGAPVNPISTARDFLLALGVPADEIPAATEAMLESYRTLLSRLQVLVLLDNVRDVAQVRPLLPGGSQSLAVITSRNRLRGLVTQDRAFQLDVLGPEESMMLFGGRVGAHRVAEEPAAAARLVELCAGLPLALAVVAARATLDQHPLGMLVQELEHAALDALDTDDPLTSVRAVFSWTFGWLSPVAARLFVLLGLHPGPDVTEPAATSLMAQPSADALDELVRYSLINSQNGRYRLHDLMRSYAAEEAALRLSAAERADAQRRFFDHLMHSALAAAVRSDPLRQPITTPDPAPGAVVLAFEVSTDADRWYAEERAVFGPAVVAAGEAGFDGHVWRTVWAIRHFLLATGRWREGERLQRLAVTAARRAGDLEGECRARRGLVSCLVPGREFDEAERQLRAAVALDERLGDLIGLSNDLRGLAYLLARQDEHLRALDPLLRALDVAMRSGDRIELASVSASLAFVHHELGDHHEAAAHAEQARDMYLELVPDERDTVVASNRDTLGSIYRALGRYEEAEANYLRSVELQATLSYRHYQADTLVRLADMKRDLGELDAARGYYLAALDVYDDLGNAQADDVRELLASLN